MGPLLLSPLGGLFSEVLLYLLLIMFKIKCDLNQQYLKTVDPHFLKSERDTTSSGLKFRLNKLAVKRLIKQPSLWCSTMLHVQIVNCLYLSFEILW